MFAALLQIVLDPIVAGHVAAAMLGEPGIGDAMARVCARESRCSAIGVHEVDAHRSRAAWTIAAQAGTLDPATCEWHRLDAGPWSTSGPWGAMRAFTLPHVRACLPAWALDVPLVGAIAVARRMASARCSRSPACVRWRGPVAEAGARA